MRKKYYRIPYYLPRNKSLFSIDLALFSPRALYVSKKMKSVTAKTVKCPTLQEIMKCYKRNITTNMKSNFPK